MVVEEDTTNNYRIKDIKFFGSPRRILLQSANGPCPLLGICNVLLLRNQLKIPQDTRYISFSELVQMVSNILFDINATYSSGDQSTSSRAANVRENLTSCLEVLPRLNVGLDVNCKFAGPQEFEYTQELTVFDLLDIGLFHGWIVSRQDEKSFSIFGNLSYNQVVEKLIAFEEAQQSILDASAAAAKAKEEEVAAPSAASTSDQAAAPEQAADGATASTAEASTEAAAASSPSSAEIRPCSPTSDPATQKSISEGLLIKEFMDRTASQLSYDGLLALYEAVRERELAVFFRNSHFSAMLKYSGDLYLLCTDIAFASSAIIWERLDEVDGDTSYCDADFKEHIEGAHQPADAASAQELALAQATAGPPVGPQSDADAALAWQLMQEDLQAQQASEAQARQMAAYAAAQAQAQAHAQVQQQPQPAPFAPQHPSQEETVVGTVVGTGRASAPVVGGSGCGSCASGSASVASSQGPAGSKKGKKPGKTGKSCTMQ